MKLEVSMNKQDKFVTKWITWVVMPDGYKYVSCVIENDKDACESRYGELMKDPYWNGYKFINVPIAIPLPDEIANKVSMEEDND